MKVEHIAGKDGSLGIRNEIGLHLISHELA